MIFVSTFFCEIMRLFCHSVKEFGGKDVEIVFVSETYHVISAIICECKDDDDDGGGVAVLSSPIGFVSFGTMICSMVVLLHSPDVQLPQARIVSAASTSCLSPFCVASVIGIFGTSYGLGLPRVRWAENRKGNVSTSC